jgi:hypothetical protein
MYLNLNGWLSESSQCLGSSCNVFRAPALLQGTCTSSPVKTGPWANGTFGLPVRIVSRSRHFASSHCLLTLIHPSITLSQPPPAKSQSAPFQSNRHRHHNCSFLLTFYPPINGFSCWKAFLHHRRPGDAGAVGATVELRRASAGWGQDGRIWFAFAILLEMRIL